MQGQYFTPDLPLTNVSQAYRPDPAQFIADLVAPVVMVPKKQFNVYYYGKENLKQVVDDSRTRFGATKQAQMSITSKAFGPLRSHELMDGIDFDQENMTEAPLDLEIDITNFLNDQMALAKEVAVAKKLSDTSVITQYSTPTHLWDDYLTTTVASDPFSDLKTAVNTVALYGLRKPNTLILSQYVFSILQNHPGLIDRVKYSNIASLTLDLMAQAFSQFGISKILVSAAVKDTAKEGLTASNDWVWGKNALLAYITPTPGLRQVNGAYTFTLENGKYVDSWFDQRKKTKWIRNNDYYDVEVVGPEAFYLLSGVVS